MSVDSAFKVEYAQSGRSNCIGCKSTIKKNTIRFAVIVQSPKFDGKISRWYHKKCFYKKVKFDDIQTIKGFEDLRWKDQEIIRQQIERSSTAKQPNEQSDVSPYLLSDLNEESPAVSNRKRKGEIDANDDATTVKQPKLEDEIQIKKEQSELLWNYKDALRKEIPQVVMKQLLEFNSQKTVSGEYNLIEAVSDCMLFGALEHCPECGGFIVFNYTIYHCTGNITEWTKCSYSTQLPNRKPFEIPDDVKQQYNIFKYYEYTKRNRLMTKIMQKSISTTKAATGMRDYRPKYNPKLPLKGYSIVLAGRLSKTTATLQKEIEYLGGKVLSIVDATVDVVISTPDEVRKNSKKIQDAQLFEIHVVPVQFLNDTQTDQTSIVMKKLKTSTWGILPHIRKQQVKGSARSKKSVPEKSQ